jgi:hypothetical protein
MRHRPATMLQKNAGVAFFIALMIGYYIGRKTLAGFGLGPLKPCAFARFLSANGYNMGPQFLALCHCGFGLAPSIMFSRVRDAAKSNLVVLGRTNACAEKYRAHGLGRRDCRNLRLSDSTCKE